MRPPAPAGGPTHTSYYLALAIGQRAGVGVSSKLSLPLAYRGVQAVTGNEGVNRSRSRDRFCASAWSHRLAFYSTPPGETF